ncbi:hypothetical protein [Lysobacter humi (ex Lee et al. 2017)]
MARDNHDTGETLRGGDPAPGGSSLGASRQDTPVATRQAVEGRENDDLAAASEQEAFIRGARSTPPMGDVRSDDMGAPNGEPL